MTYDPSKQLNRNIYNDFTKMLNRIFKKTNKDEDIALIIWNRKQEVVYVSHLVEEFININPNDLYGLKWRYTLSELLVYNIEQVLNKLINNKKNDYFEKEQIKYIFKFIHIDDQPYYVCQLKDQSYLYELEEQLSQIQKGIVHTEKMAITGEFSAGLIHEIRNPLTSLKGFLQLLQYGIEQNDEYYRVMIDEVEKIEQLMTELLKISKPFTQHKKNISLNQMVNDTILIIKLQKQYREIVFEINEQSDTEIYCNEQQIKQVLINLFKNASEAMNMNGTIIVNLIETSHGIQLDVIDEGSGLSEDIIDRKSVV